MTKEEIMRLPADRVASAISAIDATNDERMITLREWYDSKSSNEQWESFLYLIASMEEIKAENDLIKNRN